MAEINHMDARGACAVTERVHVQLPEAGGTWPEGAQYREGFRQWVARHAKSTDRVVLLESNPVRLDRLRALWASDPRAEVRHLHVSAASDSAGEAILFAAHGDTSKDPIQSIDAEMVLTHVPNARLVAQPVASVGAADFITEVTSQTAIGMLSMLSLIHI